MSALAQNGPSATLQPENYRFLQEMVYGGSGIVLEHDKHYLVDARLSCIARQHGLPSIDDLCNLLRATTSGTVRSQVIEAMTTNETYFFREPAQYDAIKDVLFPELKERRSLSRQLNFWSAAASTGQEAYSLAMLLHQGGFDNWDPHILGTDLNTQVLQKARAGEYLQLEINRGLPVHCLTRFFQKSGLNWIVNDQLRRTVRFEQRDLRDPMRTLGPFDAVFCRNVLIYFDAATRRQILREIHKTMSPGGWLFLGTSESASGIDDLFDRRAVGGALTYVAR
jgi:chemotaxis protein methyltransferase CheR